MQSIWTMSKYYIKFDWRLWNLKICKTTKYFKIILKVFHIWQPNGQKTLEVSNPLKKIKQMNEKK